MEPKKIDHQTFFDFENHSPETQNHNLQDLQVTLPPLPNSFTVSALAPWFGSNRTLGCEVGQLLANANWVGIPFAGGLSEVPHIRARTIVVNDLHREMINLAYVTSDERLGPMLYRRLRRNVFHPDNLKKSQEECAKFQGSDASLSTIADDETRLRLAESYFVVVWMGRSSVAGTEDELNSSLSIRWNANGGDSVRRYQSAIRSLNEWRRTLRRASFSTLDVFDFLDHCRDEHDHAIYCDQPFPGPGKKYKHKFSDQQTVQLSKRLAQFEKTRVVCRFYDHPLIRCCYPESIWNWNCYLGRKQTNEQTVEVLLVRN